MHFKKIVSLLIVFLFFLQHSGSSQDPAVVTGQASGKKIADGQYEIKLNGTIKAGWHVYLKTNAAAGLEDIKVSFSDSAVQETGTRQVSGNISSIDDVRASSTVWRPPPRTLRRCN
jgi:hypothetical protein